VNNKRPVQWTEIDTSSDDSGDELQLDLTKDPNEETNEREESKDTRRGILTVSHGKKTETKEDDQDQSEGKEDQDEGTQGKGQTRELDDEDNSSSGKKNRAHKRIQALLQRDRENKEQIARLAAEVQRVTGRSRAQEKTSVIQQRDQWEQAIKDKEEALEEAVNKQDGKEAARLSRELADATMRFNAFKAVAEDLEQESEDKTQQQQQQSTPNVPEAAKDWLSKNQWFRTDAKRHALARMISAELSQEGELDPNDDDYWEELDKRLEEFGGKPKDSKKKVVKQEESQEEEQDEPQVKVKRKSSPVGSRSDEDGESPVRLDKQFQRTGNKVSATPTDSDYDMAERMGVDIKGYMREKFKYAEQGYKGYVNIDIPGQ
jgi:hypothetical protein